MIPLGDEAKKTKEEVDSAVNPQALISKNTFFPFDLFPDTVTLDRAKITIIKRNFFMDEEIKTLKIEEVKDVQVNLGPFFATIVIDYGMNSRAEIKYFKRSDATDLKNVIEAYLIALKKNIDLNSVSSIELSAILKDSGK